MNKSLGAALTFTALGIAAAVGVPIISRVNASAPQPNVVRLVRVGEGRWEGTACWPADAGPSPRCYKTGMTGWEPPHFAVDSAPPHFVDAGF